MYSKLKQQVINATIFAVYLVISCALTFPLIFHMRSVVFADFGDSRGGLWWLWAKTNGLLELNINELIAAPFGVIRNVVIQQPISDGLFLLPAYYIGEIAAHNLANLLAYPLTAFFTFLMLNRLLKNKFTAFFGGFIFGFSPGAIMQALGGHAANTLNLFVPIFLLSLFLNRVKRNVISAFIVGLSYVLITLTSLYVGYFAIFIVLFFIVFDYVTRDKIAIKHFIVNYVYIALFAVVLIIPFLYKVIAHQLIASSADLIRIGHIRDFGSLIVYSARPLEYILPSIDHPVLGSFVYAFSPDSLHRSNYFEQTLYLGVVPLGLCLTGYFLRFYKRDTSIRHQYFIFFSVGALFMLLLSMPPLISFGNSQIPTVSYFMYKIAPMFRVYARFGILANFFLACTAAVVLTELSQRMRPRRYYLLLAILLPLMLFEYWSIPPYYAHSIDQPPAVYQWLAKEPGEFIIAEYPMMKSDESAFNTYLFWQRVHKKRMVNGATPDNPKAWKFFERVRDLTDPETPRLLKSVGVKYIIVHQKMYKEGPIPTQLKCHYPPEVSSLTYSLNETYTDDILGKPYKTIDDDIVFAL